MRLGRVTLYFILLCLPVTAQNPPTSNVANNAATGGVSGQVVLATDGTPLRKVTVTLISTSERVYYRFGQQPGNSLTKSTDATGHFQFGAVPPGEYRVGLDRTGFLSAGRMSQQDSSQSVSVSKGQQVDGLLFRMQPAGVIRGKIVDEDGDPLTGVTVIATTGSGQAINGSGPTNDLGEYRIAGLKPGRYFIVAQGGGQAIPSDGRSESDRVYAPTFFPGVMEKSGAATIDVHAGDEVEASFGLVATRTFSVRGQVSGLTPTNSQQRQNQGIGNIALVRPDSQWAPPAWAQLMPDGRFNFTDVVPGTYRAIVNLPNGEDSNLTPGTDIVEVRGSDVEGLRLAAGSTGEVRGHFRMDTGQAFDWAQLNVFLDPQEPERAQAALIAKADKDGSFTIKNVPAGNYHVIVTANSNNLLDYIVKEVNVNGKDAGDSGFTTGPGVSILDIVASANGSAILGTVVDGDNKTVADVEVVCVPDENRRKRHDIFQRVRTDKRGQFSLRGLNPGEYTVFALREDAEDITDPEFVQEHQAEGQQFRLDEGEQKTVTLKFSWNQ